MTNCPNCGAVIDLEKSKCSYCGTPYLQEQRIKDFAMTFRSCCVGRDINGRMIQDDFTTDILGYIDKP